VAKADIRIDLDAKCSRCGAKGAAQNGLCLKCTGDDIVNKLSKEESMAKIEVKVQISKMEAKVKLVEEKQEGEVIDRHLITEVKVEYAGTPAKLEKVLYTLQAGHTVDVTFGSPQYSLDEAEEAKEPVTVGS